MFGIDEEKNTSKNSCHMLTFQIKLLTICCEVTLMPVRVGVDDTIRFPPDVCDVEDIPIDRCKKIKTVGIFYSQNKNTAKTLLFTRILNTWSANCLERLLQVSQENITLVNKIQFHVLYLCNYFCGIVSAKSMFRNRFQLLTRTIWQDFYDLLLSCGKKRKIWF